MKGGRGVVSTISSSALSACSNSAVRIMDCFFAFSRSTFAWALAARSASTSPLVRWSLGARSSPGWANLLLALVSGIVVWLLNVEYEGFKKVCEKK